MFQLPRLMPLTRGLLIATGVSFLLHAVVQVWLRHPLGDAAVLMTGRLTGWTAIQLVTYPLSWIIMPRSALALAFTLAMLWWSVGAFEERYGARTTAQLLGFATLAAGVLAVLVGLLAPPDAIFQPTVWFLAGWSALGWSLRHTPMNFLGLMPTRGEALVWVALVIVGVNFLTDPRVPTLAAELGAIGAGVAFVEWRKRRLPGARVSTVVSIGSARGSRGGNKKDKPEWLN